ncbi:tape measure protein [Selenomonas ruminantium]|nr:tape measure protein [Selenomonas ruminantium]
MATVRELITKITFHVDDTGLKRAEKALRRFRQVAQQAGTQAGQSLNRVSTAAQQATSATNNTRTAMSRLRSSMQGINGNGLHRVSTAAQQAANNINLVTTAANRAGSAVNRLGATSSTAANGAGTSWRQLAATIAATIAGGSIIDTANETMNLDNRLKVIQQDKQERAKLKKSLYDIGQDARADYLSLGDLFFKVRQSGAAFGIDDQKGLELTEIVSKALTTGGASTAEKNATILQLGQALGSGVLQGDELRSLKENAGQLMQYMADEMGVTVGQLKDMGAKGELTTEQVTKAILAAGKKVRADFALSTQTIGQSWERVKNAFKYSIDEIESETHIFSRIANGISTALDVSIKAARDIKNIWNGDSKTTKENPMLSSIVLGAKAAVSQVSKLYKTAKKNFSDLSVKIQYKRAKLTGSPVSPALQEQYNATLPAGGGLTGGTFDEGKQQLNDFMERIAGYIASVENLFARIGEGIRNSLEPFTSGEFSTVWAYVEGQFAAGLEKLGIAWENLGNGISAITPLLQVIAQVVGTVLVKAFEGLLVVGSWVFNGLATLIKWVTDLIDIFASAVKICANELAYLIDLAKQALQYLGLVNSSSGVNVGAVDRMFAGRLNGGVTVTNNITQNNEFPPLKETTIPKYIREVSPQPQYPNISLYY